MGLVSTTALGASWASGLRLYAVVAALGALGLAPVVVIVLVCPAVAAALAVMPRVMPGGV